MLTEVSKITTESIKTLGDYLKCREIEKTEKAKNRAKLSAIIKKIEADKEIFRNYMEKSFEERESLYRRADKVLNKAIEEADHEMVKIALNFTATIYHKNPLQGMNHTQNIPLAEVKNYLL